MYTVRGTSKFKKSFKKILKHKDFKLEVFNSVVDNLLHELPLDIKYKNHQLKGEYLGYCECHLQNDILLIYKYEEDVLWLVLADIGSHSELF